MIASSEPSAPLLSPREGFIFFSFYLLSLAICLIIPRALTFLPALVSLCGFLYAALRHHRFPAFDKKLSGFLIGFCALMMTSALWSPDPAFSFEKAWKISLVLVSGILSLSMAAAVPLQTQNRDRLVMALAALCCLAGLVIFYECLTDFSITRWIYNAGDNRQFWPEPIRSKFILNRSTVFLVLLCLPSLLMVRLSDLPKRAKNLFTLAITLCVIAALSLTNSQTAQIAALLAIPMLFFPAHRLKARRLMLLSVLAAILAAPFFAAPVHKLLVESSYDEEEGFMAAASVPHRLEVWKFVSEQIAQSPLIGHGIESMRFLRAGYIMPHMHMDHVMHPHNAVLQIWEEFGLAGIAITIAFITFLILKLDAFPPVQQRYYTLLFIVTLGVLSMGYGLWQPWLIGMLFTLASLSVIVVRLSGPNDQ